MVLLVGATSMVPGSRGGGWGVILLSILVTDTKGIEVMEQCRIMNRKQMPNPPMGSVKGTLTYSRQMYTVKTDFWKQGVGSSKKTLKKILKKINNYEEHHVKLEEEVNRKLDRRFKRLGGEDVWFDEKENRPVYKDEFCAAMDDLKTNEKKVKTDENKEINYNCVETEQLYGLGYHKVYNQCKDDPFLAKFDVEFSVCLHAHYPWIDMLQWGICVMKEYNNDFLACFCNTKGGKPDKRSFCITKFECFLHGQGLKEQRQMLVVKDSCMKAIEYFTEPDQTDGLGESRWSSEEDQAKYTSWASSGVAWIHKPTSPGTRWLDKLRVRAPYNEASTCFEKQFSSHFDVGQFKQDLASTTIKIPPTLQVDVWTPKLDGYKILPEEGEHGTCIIPETPPEPRVEQPQCGPRLFEAPIHPRVISKKQNLIDIYTERMVTTSVPWLPGIFFLYSYLFSEKSRKQKIFVNCVQFGVIILGTYNSIVSMVLWRSSLFTLTGPTQKELLVVLTSFCFSCCINYKEIGELLLINSLLHFAANILLLYIVPHIRTEQNVMTCTLMSYVISTLLTVMLIFLIWRQVDKIDKKRDKEMRLKQEMMEMIASGTRREGDKRRPGRGKGGHSKRAHTDTREEAKNFSQVYGEIEEEVKERSKIACRWAGCQESSNIGYISVSCSGQCSGRLFHTPCWRQLMHSQDLKEERAMLGLACGSSSCQGRVTRLSWFTGLGREITARRQVWESAKKSSHFKKIDEKPGHKKKETRKIQSVSPMIRDVEPEYTDVNPKEYQELDACKLKPEELPGFDNNSEDTCNMIETEADLTERFELQRVASYTQLSNTFGTIGSERKARKSLPQASPERLSSSSSSSSPDYRPGLLDELLLGEDDWSLDIPLVRTTQHRSKILSMIESNREPPMEKEQQPARHLEPAQGTGFIMELDFCGQPSSSVSYFPQSKLEGGKKAPEGTSKLSFNYISGLQDWMPEKCSLLEGYHSDEDLAIELEDDAIQICGPTVEDEDCPPLTRILRKALSGYSAAQIDEAMAAVLERVDCAHITIPDFQGLVLAHLEAAQASNDMDVEECHMCLEPMDLLDNLLALDPCQHVFHAPCVRPWLQKDPTCPKCRAQVRLQ